MDEIQILLQGALVPVIIGLVEVMKRSGMPTRFAPAASIVLGVASIFLIPMPGVSIGIIILQGVVVGLAGAGLYSGTKTTVKPTPDQL